MKGRHKYVTNPFLATNTKYIFFFTLWLKAIFVLLYLVFSRPDALSRYLNESYLNSGFTEIPLKFPTESIFCLVLMCLSIRDSRLGPTLSCLVAEKSKTPKLGMFLLQHQSISLLFVSDVQAWQEGYVGMAESSWFGSLAFFCFQAR